MGFVKGAMIGIMAGTIIGAMNSDSINDMFKKGKKHFKKMKRISL